MKKKALSLLLALSLCVGLLSCLSFAVEDGIVNETEEAGIIVNVTIANAGELALVNQPVAVVDVDEDGVLTVRDALTLAHDEYYEAADEEAGAEMAETEGAAEGENAEAAPDLPDNGFAVSDEGFIRSCGALKMAAAMAITSTTLRLWGSATRLRTAIIWRHLPMRTWSPGLTCTHI